MTMNARNRRRIVFSCLLWVLPAAASTGRGASDETPDPAVAATAESQPGDMHRLRYQFASGEEVRWRVKHLGTTETTIRGNTQRSQSRSVSTKVWRVTEVDGEGTITFVHSVDQINMWQQISGRPEVRYDSETDATPPPEYMHAAQTVGVPIATVRIAPWGSVLQRDDHPSQANIGLGDIAMPLPEEPVEIGATWFLPNEIRVRREDGQIRRIKTRLVYQLVSVKTGVATISVKTEVLTPVNDPKIQSQLVQQITNGEVKFDLDTGRILSRQIDWDETVVGFSGDDSLMKYLARFTEELMPAETTARAAGPPARETR
jgi:hypothetical protein